jgi:hypothetical protein
VMQPKFTALETSARQLLSGGQEEETGIRDRLASIQRTWRSTCEQTHAQSMRLKDALEKTIQVNINK